MKQREMMLFHVFHYCLSLLCFCPSKWLYGTSFFTLRWLSSKIIPNPMIIRQLHSHHFLGGLHVATILWNWKSQNTSQGYAFANDYSVDFPSCGCSLSSKINVFWNVLNKTWVNILSLANCQECCKCFIISVYIERYHDHFNV